MQFGDSFVSNEDVEWRQESVHDSFGYVANQMKAPMDGILFCCFKGIHLPFSLNESQIQESIFESKKSCLSFCSNMMKSELRTQSNTMITLLLLFFLITATTTFSSILLL